MSDTPTPETDAAWHSFTGNTEFANNVKNLSRKLERERDETRNQRDILRLDAQKEAEHHDRMVGELEKVYKERDEAREELKGCKYKNQRISAELLVKLRNAERERDEARQALMKIEDLFIDGTDIYADRENMGTIAREALKGAK